MKKNKSHIVNTKEKLCNYLSRGINLLRKYVFTSNNKPIFIILFLLAVLGDIFLTSSNSDISFFGLVALLIIISIFYKIKSKYTFMFCLALLVIMYIMFLTQGTSKQTEKVAVWIVLFMAVGIGQQWFENEKK